MAISNAMALLHGHGRRRRAKVGLAVRVVKGHDVVMLQETHGSMEELRMEFAVAHATHAIWGSAHAHSDKGGIAIIVKKTLFSDANAEWVTLAEGRAGLLRIVRRDGEGNVNFGVVHNHGIDVEVMNGVVEVVEGEATRCAADPWHNIFLRGSWRRTRAKWRLQPRRKRGASPLSIEATHQRHDRGLLAVADSHGGGCRAQAQPAGSLLHGAPKLATRRYASGLRHPHRAGVCRRAGHQRAWSDGNDVEGQSPYSGGQPAGSIERRTLGGLREASARAGADPRRDPPFAKLAAIKDMMREAARLAQHELRVAYAAEAQGRNMALLALARSRCRPWLGPARASLAARACVG